MEKSQGTGIESKESGRLHWTPRLQRCMEKSQGTGIERDLSAFGANGWTVGDAWKNPKERELKEGIPTEVLRRFKVLDAWKNPKKRKMKVAGKSITYFL